MKCNKITFNSIDKARERLTEIVLESDKKQKPIRVYKCRFCGKYHLTSKSEPKFNANLNKKVKRNEARFIEEESDFWKKRLGISD